MTASSGVLIHLDPRSLAKNPANIRRSVGDITGLTASVRKLGVLEPIVLAGEDPEWRVVAGHRRLASAIAADQATVPCFVPELNGTSDTMAMATENLQRLDLTVGEEAAAYLQLQAEGLDVDEIADRTGMNANRVQMSLKVAVSKPAVAVAKKLPELTLDQAVAFVEFDGNKAALDALTLSVKKDPAQFDHVAARWRMEAKAQAAYDAEAAKLTEAGVVVLSPGTNTAWNPSAKNCALEYLADAKGKSLTAGTHKKCEGHAAIVQRRYGGHVDVTYVCTDPKAQGHRGRNAAPARPKQTEAEKAAADKDRERAKAEADAASDRAQQWEAARTVRVEHVKKLLPRKVPPKGTLRFVVDMLALNAWVIGDGDEQGQVLEDLGVEMLEVRAPKATDAQLPMILLAPVVGCVEDLAGSWHVDSLRLPYNASQLNQVRRYFEFLETTGYTLAPIEELIAKPPKATPAKKAAKKATKK